MGEYSVYVEGRAFVNVREFSQSNRVIVPDYFSSCPLFSMAEQSFFAEDWTIQKVGYLGSLAILESNWRCHVNVLAVYPNRFIQFLSTTLVRHLRSHLPTK